ncbi:MAG: hypothetical protein CFH06_00236 [Alphaproteobacteria bacterium MarineAlpha3_Bin5]|nr:hypothetical protein [Magnetovibrio sp.]PPR79822.1 MAG: hypothetical protein CFH06_00236 [Alphaproteobacteria bacterium MarineAlpha3_Bin5]
MNHIHIDTAIPKKQTTTQKCQFVGDLPRHLKQSYSRLALITDDECVLKSIPEDNNTLIVCCDWLLWHRLMEKKQINYPF